MANGVIDSATGDLLRAGFVQFDQEPVFNASKESFRSDVPVPFYVKGKKKKTTQFHRWNGTQWILVTQEAIVPTEELKYRVQSFSGHRLWQIRHYTTESTSASGFSGFSGLGRQDEYLYSGNALIGFSSQFFDASGVAWSSSFATYETDSKGNYIKRDD